jgi:hypothetical protein
MQTMPTLTFQAARKRHIAVASAAECSESDAASLWNAIIGTGEDAAGSYSEAVRDTFPEPLAPLLASNPVAAAYALECHAPNMSTSGAPILLRDRARAAWHTVSERASSTEKLATGFGWDLSAAWEVSADVHARGDNLDSVAKIAQLAGRMYASIRGANAHRVPGMGGEIHSVEQGNNVGRLLASELVLLTDDLMETLVLERISTRRALQYSVRGTSKANRGPMVVLLDESGSMRSDAHGNPNNARNEWAKAAAVAIARVAKDEGRPFVAIHFSTSCVTRRLDPTNASAVMDMVRHFLSGGTRVAMALSVGLDECQALAQAGAKGADLILVTDGVDGDTEGHAAQVARMAAGNVRLWTVAVECAIPESSPLRAGAAGYLPLGAADLSNAKSAVSLARATK